MLQICINVYFIKKLEDIFLLLKRKILSEAPFLVMGQSSFRGNLN